jgi:hypothetical protein
MNSRGSIREECWPYFKYCSVYCRCWVATSERTTKVHSLISNKFLIDKTTRLLLGNAFVNKHFPI